MCGRPAHMVLILRTISAKHEQEINIRAWSVLSILISRIHKHINGNKKGGVRERGKRKGGDRIAYTTFIPYKYAKITSNSSALTSSQS